MKVAWIGLGQMGLPTAKTVAAAGHEVRAYDVAPPAAADAQRLTLVASVPEAVQDCDLLCIAVFSDTQVEEILTGPEGVLSGLRPGVVVAIFTTGSIEAPQALAAQAPAGVTMLDTCFSRSNAETATGRLTLLVGGDAEGIERGRPVFESFARAIFHVGPSGSGRKIKLVNNILFAGNLQIAVDALRLAEGLGLDRSATATALMECSGRNDVLATFIDQDYGVVLDTVRRYMIKDVTAATDAANAVGVELPALGAATAPYQEG